MLKSQSIFPENRLWIFKNTCMSHSFCGAYTRKLQ